MNSRGCPGVGVAAGDQPADPPAAVQAPDAGQLRRHVPRGQPQRVGAVRPHHAPRLLGAQLRLPAQLLLQRLHQPVSPFAFSKACDVLENVFLPVLNVALIFLYLSVFTQLRAHSDTFHPGAAERQTSQCAALLPVWI